MKRLTPLPEPTGSTQSPCVRNCCLDENEVCLGCGRLLEEILAWRRLSDAEREQILQLAYQRRMLRKRAISGAAD